MVEQLCAQKPLPNLVEAAKHTHTDTNAVLSKASTSSKTAGLCFVNISCWTNRNGVTFMYINEWLLRKSS